MSQTHEVKSGIVALIGPPNVGKSTLLNSLLGQKISIVSPKPQTTRNRIVGVVNGPEYQLVLLDTPGIHQARDPLNIEMVKIALTTLAEVDAVVFMVDVTMPLPGKTPPEYLPKEGQPVVLVINKIDTVSKEKLLPVITAYQGLYPFTAVIPLSALTNDGTDLLVAELCRLLPVGPRLYPEEIPTDATERFIVAEMIREKIFLKARDEVPYSTAVTVESFKEDELKGLTTIHATIVVEKDSQKGIIIGKGGAMLKAIGQAARKDIEELLGRKTMLKLWVRVEKNWTKNPRMLKEFGF
jgi:GTP-binding protein Era